MSRRLHNGIGSDGEDGDDGEYREHGEHGEWRDDLHNAD